LDAKAEDDELLYKVLKVASVGPSMFKSISPGRVAVAKLSDLLSFRVVDR